MTQQIVAAPAAQQHPFADAAMPTTGRWGWYQDHQGGTYRRTSTLVKEVETDTHHLDLWKGRQAVEGMAIRDDLVLALKAMGRPPAGGWSREQKKQIDEIVEKAQEAARVTDGAITGTAMHTLTERVDRGEPVAALASTLPGDAAQSLRAYAALRELNGWRTVEIERTVVCEDVEVAGTFDRVDFVPGLAALLGPGVCQYDGPHHGHSGEADGWELPVVVDVKTEKDPTQNGLHIGPQLAIYSRAGKMWKRLPGERDSGRTWPSGDPIMLPNGEYVPAPCVRQDVAIVVHVAGGDANPLLLNLAEGWEAAVAAYEQINRKARAKRKVGAAGAWFAPLPAKRQSRVESFVQTQAAADLADPYRPGPGQAAMLTGEIPASVQPVEFEAVRDPGSGVVSWVPAANQRPGSMVTAAEAATDVVRGQLIEAIWKARTVDALAILWKMAQDRGVRWSGPIEMAGNARRRQIECVQRELHNETLPKGSTKCACGWIAGQAG